jgi:RNA polymerase sigma-70 factor, ECF subfamily
VTERSGDVRHETGQIVALNERRLLPRHCAGDPTAFQELMQRFRAPVFGYLVRCGIDRSSAEDVFQEVFIKIHNAAASYAPDRPLKPWLFTIVVNTVRSHYRRERIRQLVLEPETSERPGVEPPADELLEALETAAALEEALELLTLAEREVVLLATVEQLTQKDLALVLDLPVGTIKTHMHRARATLTRALSRRTARLVREVSP